MNPELQARLRGNLGQFYLAINPQYSYVDYQQRFMAPALQKVANHEIEALILLMPPGHAKTDVGTRALVPWCFGRWPERSNMVLSYSDDFAKRFGRTILNTVKSDLHREIFPECELSGNARQMSFFVTTKGGNFYSAGFGGKITGQRVDGVLVIDDPHKNMDEARSPAVQEMLIETYRSTINMRLNATASRVLCVTRWCRNDFVDQVLAEEGLLSEGGKWVVLKLPAEAGQNDPLGRIPGQLLWPEHLGEKWYADRKRNTQTWMALMQQDPQAAGGKYFKREWLQFYDKPIKPGRFPAYMICDPAKSKSRASDRTAILVLVATPARNLLLVDAVVARLDPDERADMIISLARKWKPIHRFIYEEFTLTTDTWYLTQAMHKSGLRVYPIPIGRKGHSFRMPKESRIELLIPNFRQGQIWFPTQIGRTVRLTGGETTGEGAVEMDVMEYVINHEYLGYSGEGSVEHDDFLDALSRIHEPELGIVYPMGELEAEERAAAYSRTKLLSGSWESLY